MKTSETTPAKSFPTPRESKQDNSTPLSGAVVDSSATGAASEGGRKEPLTPTSTGTEWQLAPILRRVYGSFESEEAEEKTALAMLVLPYWVEVKEFEEWVVCAAWDRLDDAITSALAEWESELRPVRVFSPDARKSLFFVGRVGK